MNPATLISAAGLLLTLFLSGKPPKRPPLPKFVLTYKKGLSDDDYQAVLRLLEANGKVLQMRMGEGLVAEWQPSTVELTHFPIKVWGGPASAGPYLADGGILTKFRRA